MDRVRVVVVCDAPLLRLGLSTILRQDARLTVVAELATVREPVVPARRLPCDVLLVHQAAGAAVTAARMLEYPAADGQAPKVLLLTEQYSREEMLATMRSGVHGYAVMSGLAPEELCNGVVVLAQHGLWACPVATRHLFQIALLDRVSTAVAWDARLAAREPVKPDLSKQELAVLRSTAAGLREVEIAQELSVSPNTVKTYLRRICDKLQTNSRAEAIQIGIRLGLVADRRREGEGGPLPPAPGEIRRVKALRPALPAEPCR